MRFLPFSLWSIVVPAVLAGGAGYGLMGQKPEAAGESPVPPMALTSPAIPKLEEGNPWEFYARGDWRNAVFNFGRAGAKARHDDGVGPVEMGRGVAAFKAATADAAHFDDTLMETAIEAFGAALATGDTAVLENAHYNLANAIFERAKSAEKQRALAESKAKSRKAQKRHAITLKYLDGLIRRLENCLEHYQETLVLNAGRSDAQTNHDTVLELVKHLREIRIHKIRTGGLLKKKKKKMKCEGKCEGKCDGECEGSGLGKGSGASEEEEEDDEDGEGEDKVQDESNREFNGTPRTAGDPGEAEDRDGDEENGAPEDVDPHSDGESRRNEIIRRLKNLSQELPVRERHKIAPEDRPFNDW